MNTINKGFLMQFDLIIYLIIISLVLIASIQLIEENKNYLIDFRKKIDLIRKANYYFDELIEKSKKVDERKRLLIELNYDKLFQENKLTKVELIEKNKKIELKQSNKEGECIALKKMVIVNAKKMILKGVYCE